MQTLLTTYFLAAFAAVGISLDCEECVGLGSICQGPKKTCSANEDTCAIIVSESLGSMNTTKSMKRCLESTACIRDPISFNLGPGLIATTQIFCCVEEECESPPAWRPRNFTLNGKKCPSCLSTQAKCKEEIVPCAGNENYCFQISGSSTVVGILAEIHMKGCANKAACDSKEVITDVAIPGINVKQKAVCTGGSANIFPGLLAVNLVVLTGLLLVNYLV
uniref:Phospholipase A2 inhibitor and Ly6/PLAUR domain-containing protein-like n=1 Tax=Salvator merianae TaxID=96440 RepID=A0A8D0BDA0_SALMN